jgi:hypothetical protein
MQKIKLSELLVESGLSDYKVTKISKLKFMADEIRHLKTNGVSYIEITNELNMEGTWITVDELRNWMSRIRRSSPITKEQKITQQKITQQKPINESVNQGNKNINPIQKPVPITGGIGELKRYDENKFRSLTLQQMLDITSQPD